MKLLDFRKVQTSSFSESAFCEKMHVWVSRIFTFFMSYSWRWGEGEKKIKETFLLRHYSAIFWERHSKTKNLRLWSFSYIYISKSYTSVGPVLWCTNKKHLANFFVAMAMKIHSKNNWSLYKTVSLQYCYSCRMLTAC